MKNYIVVVMLLIGFMGISQVPVLPQQPIQRTITVYPYQVITQTGDFYTFTQGPTNANIIHGARTVDTNLFLDNQMMLDGTIVNLPRRASNLFPEPSNVYVVPAYRRAINPNDKR